MRKGSRRFNSPPTGRFPEFHNFVHFTYSEYLDFAINREPEIAAMSYGISQQSSRKICGDHTEWTGCRTFEEATKFAQEGWTEGREFVGQIVDQIDHVEARMVSLPAPMNDVSGDYVDIGAYLEGIPENMVRWEEQESFKRVVRILFNMCTTGGVSVDAMRWRGATVLALIDRLEAQNIRVELDLAVKSGNHSDSSTNTVVVTLKEAQEPLHLDRLAFHLVHPASFRRIMFSVWERMPAEVVNNMQYYADHGYGSVKRHDDPSYDLVIPEMHLNTVEDSVREIEKMFNVVCGVELKGELI